MADIVFRRWAPSDLTYVARHMRQADRDELRATSSDSAWWALTRSALVSTHIWTVADRETGEPIAVFGVAPLSATVGSPWLLGTDRVRECSKALVREGKRYANLMLHVYPHLFNYVHVANARSIRWLKALGFTLHDPVPYGTAGELFHPFERKAPCALPQPSR